MTPIRPPAFFLLLWLQALRERLLCLLKSTSSRLALLVLVGRVSVSELRCSPLESRSGLRPAENDFLFFVSVAFGLHYSWPADAISSSVQFICLAPRCDTANSWRHTSVRRLHHIGTLPSRWRAASRRSRSVSHGCNAYSEQLSECRCLFADFGYKERI